MEFMTEEDNLKTVMVHGETGSGKSTYVQQYCEENNLKPVCIDLANTNRTGVPRVKVELDNHIRAFRSINKVIQEVSTSGEFDTVIIDGYTRLEYDFEGTGNGMLKWAERAKCFKDLEKALRDSKVNWIITGQPDLRAREQTDESNESKKYIISINELVNEQYHCTREGNRYFVECEKNREAEPYERKEITNHRGSLR